MKSFIKRNLWISVMIALLSLASLFIGIRFIAGNEIVGTNIAAYLVFTAVLGLISYILMHFRLRFIFWCFIAGLLVGFAIMFSSFINDMSGWGDLIGILSLMTWIVIGLAGGILAQLINYVYIKLKKKQ